MAKRTGAQSFTRSLFKGFGKARAKTLEEERRTRLFEKREEFRQGLRKKRRVERFDATGIDSSLFKGSLNAKGEPIIKAKSQSELLDEGIRKAKKGEVSFDVLKERFPRQAKKLEEIRVSALPRVKKERGFRRGTGSFISKFISDRSIQQAEINAETQFLIEQLGNAEDVAELIRDFREDPDQFKAIANKKFENDPDIEAIMEFFGLPKNISPENVVDFFKSLRK